MIMEGSSESGRRKSDSSRGLNSSAVSDRPSRSRFLGDASQEFDLIHGRKGIDRAADYFRNQVGYSGVCEDELAMNPFVHSVDWCDVSLRQWLDNTERSVDALECLHIFMQVVEIVNLAHSQGIVVHNVRPSCFIMSSFNRISFIESASCSDSGSDSLEDGLNNETAEFKGSMPALPPDLYQKRNQIGRVNSQPNVDPAIDAQVVSDNSCLQSSSVYATHLSFEEGSNVEQAEEKKHPFPMKQILTLETSWYTSPEEVSGASGSCSSDIYRLGVLLFELFCTFSSAEEKRSTMSSLRHRVLPPQLLLKWPKEASFCLWLLHPEPSSRPKMGELLQSDFLTEPRDNIEEREAAIDLRERIEDQELLMEFLLLMQQRKQEVANSLQDIVSFITSDIDEIAKLQTTLRQKAGFCLDTGKDPPSGVPSINPTGNDDSVAGSRKRIRQGLQMHHPDESDDHGDEVKRPEAIGEGRGNILFKSSRLMKNFNKLESAYFLTRRKSIKILPGKPSCRHSAVSSDGKGSMAATERSSVNNISSKVQYSDGRPSGWVNSFLEGLCKYLTFTKLKVKADVKQGDLLNSSNLVCSLSFDRDGEFFATAGVNKKIKVFEYNTLLNEGRDLHYPVVEMASRSKLSSICWNGYIKSQIASSNFEGVVQVWDVTRSQVFMELKEHERRVWSVDFSLADPTMLASGSDDGSVKLWNINQGVSVGTIKTKANVCCVQFPSDSGRSIAFGSADHRIYYYDLRNSKMPVCTLIGHNKTVSYVKFIDSTNLVTASTDNTVKLWDLSTCSARVLDSPVQSFTGHTNVKNFVGLSVSDGYIATGSETNEVFVYHKAFPMPALSYKFNNSDPHTGDDEDDPAQFVSSVCWRGQSSTLVAANSAGNIKLLEMV